jgi:hypothetical protein
MLTVETKVNYRNSASPYCHYYTKVIQLGSRSPHAGAMILKDMESV